MADKKVFGNDGPTNPDLPMTTFDKSYTNNLTLKFGRVYPSFVDMVPPHSTAHITPHFAFDMMPTVQPIQADITVHTSVFKIPLRILWRNYKDFFSRIGDHKVPYISRSENWCETGSLADYMGLPTMNFREVDRPGKLFFRRTGYIDEDFAKLLISRESLFLLDGADTPSFNGANYLSMRAQIREPLMNGLFNFPFLSESILPTGNLPSSMTLYLAAFRCTRSMVQNYEASNLSPFSTGWRILEHINGLVVRDTSPLGGSNYPYDDLEPGRFSTSHLSTPVTYGSTTYQCQSFLIRLSDNFLAALNDLISRAETDQVVFFQIAYAKSYTQLGGSVLPGSPSVSISPATSAVSFDNPIHSVYSDGQVQKDSVTNLLDSTGLNPIYLGINSGAYVTYKHQEKSDFENPFVAGPNGNVPKIPINAFTFRAYEFLQNFVFRNQRVDPFLKLNPDTGEMEPTYNQFLTNDGDGADSTTPVDFFDARYEYDMFTLCQKTPQFGNAPLVGITTNDDPHTAEIRMRGQRILDDGSTQEFPFTIAVSLTDDNRISQITNYDEVADEPSVMRLNEAIRYGISINDFRSVNAFQIMQERFLKAGYQYQDLVQEFFGVKPPIGEEFPEFLGGCDRKIQVSKIMNTALSESAALGEFAGTGSVSGHGERIECFTSEWCIIMGLSWVTVTPIYSQKLDKHFTYSDYLDFYNPALMHIGPQPVFKYQLAPLQLPRDADGDLIEDRIHDVFGYNRPNADMVSKQDEAHGEFRSTMHSFLLQRLFQTVPDLGHEFITMDASDLTDIFSYVADTDKFYGAIRWEYFLKMPMPEVVIPKII